MLNEETGTVVVVVRETPDLPATLHEKSLHEDSLHINVLGLLCSRLMLIVFNPTKDGEVRAH